MSIPALVAALAFVIVVALIGGVMWALESRRRLAQRLTEPGAGAGWDTEILRVDPTATARGAQKALIGRLHRLAEEAGYPQAADDVMLYVGGLALLGGLLGWIRLGGLIWILGGMVLFGVLPIVFLVYKRQRRFRQFEEAFPDALDTMSRAIRAGNALSGAIQVVAEEAPDPVGAEFRRVFESIRLGVEPGEALTGLAERIDTEDVRFFAAAVRIQRGAGGNLAEILDRLSEVIRERFKILAHARVLSAQHKWSAICVGLSPIVFAFILEFMRPGYFDPMWKSELAPYLLGGGIAMEIVGFLLIWKIAQIKV